MMLLWSWCRAVMVAVVVMAGPWGGEAESNEGDRELWECHVSEYGAVLELDAEVVAEGDLENGEGVVVVRGVRQAARFGIFGFDRRWRFGDGLEYVFAIGADGVGRYYDFSDVVAGERVQSSQVFTCVEVAKKAAKVPRSTASRRRADSPPPPQAKQKLVPRQVAKAVPAPRRKPKPQPGAFDTLLRDLERQRKKAAQVPPATTPRRQADSSPSPAQRLQAGLQQQRLIAALVRQIRERVRPCWNPPIGIKDAHKIQVGIRIALNTDGTLIGRPRIVDQRRLAADPVFRAYAESAVRALQNPRCSPLRLPLDSYSAWRSISFDFDTRELLE